MTDGTSLIDTVRLEPRDAVYWITIDREARRNALNETVVARIAAGIEAAIADKACRAIVLTAAGERSFCAGADLNKNVEGGAFEVDFSQPRHYLVALFRQMEAAGIDVLTARPQVTPEPIDTPVVAEIAPDAATVTPIEAAQRKRTDGPRPA